MAAKPRPRARRIDFHMWKFSRALTVVEDLERHEPAQGASFRDVSRHYKRKEAAYRAMGTHRKALDDGIERTAGLKEKAPGVTQLLCRRIMDEPWCKAKVEPWLTGERSLTAAEIARMALFVANKWGEPKPLPAINTIRRQLTRQFQKKRVKPSGVDTLTK